MATAARRVTLLRSHLSHNPGFFYARALVQAGVILEDRPFDPRRQPPPTPLPESDLLLVCDSGVLMDMPAVRAHQGRKEFLAIDAHHKLDQHQAYAMAHGFDRVWVSQPQVADEFQGRGAWLPVAADPDYHSFRPALAAGESWWRRIRYRSYYDVGLCAARYQHRQDFEKLFRHAGLTTNFHYGTRFLTAATREVARCTIGFNVAAGFVPHGQKKFIGRDVNMRIFETMANGQAMLLTNVWEGVGFEELFREGEEFVGYRTAEEAVEKTRHYAAHTEEAAAIARAGQRVILERHTYLHRCRTLLA